MNRLALLLLCIFQWGCNYSLTKSPLAFRPTQAGLEQFPAGKIADYNLVANSILKPRCLECHSGAGGNDGGINLETYENVIANLGIIKDEVASGSMPKNREKLSAKEKEVLFAWIDAGGPKEGSVSKTEPTPAPTPIPVPLPTPEPSPTTFTYEMVNTAVIQPRCISCHSDAGGNRGEVNLETYENVAALAPDIEAAILSGSMPRPRNKPLTTEQKEMILKWISIGFPKN